MHCEWYCCSDKGGVPAKAGGGGVLHITIHPFDPLTRWRNENVGHWGRGLSVHCSGPPAERRAPTATLLFVLIRVEPPRRMGTPPHNSHADLNFVTGAG